MLQTPESLAEIALQIIPEKDAAHGFSHTERVWKNALKIAENYSEVDIRLLCAACFFHDIGRFIGPENIGHAEKSAKWCRKNLPDFDFSEEETELISTAVAEHSFSASSRPTSMLSKILQDADRLDALGAIGIARVFSTGHANILYHRQEPFALTRKLDDSQYVLDHFDLKLFSLENLFNTPEAKKSAQERIAFMRQFIAALQLEIK